MQAKGIQFVTIFHIMKRGRPMSYFGENRMLYQVIGLKNVPQSHLSDTSGWEIAKCLSMVEKEDMKLCVQKAKYISISLDEVTAVDNTS